MSLFEDLAVPTDEELNRVPDVERKDSFTDRDSGIITSVYYDDAEDTTVVNSHQDAEPVINRNKRLLLQGDDGYSADRSDRRVASIPNNILQKWLLEEGISIFDEDDWPKIAARLDDPSWRWLRTAPGVVSKAPTRQHERPKTNHRKRGTPFGN